MNILVLFVAIALAVFLLVYAINETPMNPPWPTLLKVIVLVGGALGVLMVAGFV